MWESLKKFFYLKDLRSKILIVFLLLIIFRILAHIPMPGVNLDELRQFFATNQVFGMLNLFTGGAMENFSLAMMGVGPYITASIIFQLLIVIVPSLEALNKEGEYGRAKINHYTRIATVPLAFIQSYTMIILLKNQGVLGVWEPLQLITMLISLTAGTILVMWIGELISENGIGNGISLIITLGIITGVPTQFAQTISALQAGDPSQIIGLVVFMAIAIVVTASIVFISDGERQIQVTYARRQRGIKSYGGVDTHLPLRVAMAGVIPIIFALSMMILPSVIAKFFEQAKSAQLAHFATSVEKLFQNNIFYGACYFILVILFTFFYTFVIFNPNQVAENLQKRGGFVPGLRPGIETAEYLKNVLYKITLVGAVFLGLVAVLPFIVQSITHITTLVLGGTGILIVVNVVLETMRQVKAQLVMRQYDQY